MHVLRPRGPPRPVAPRLDAVDRCGGDSPRNRPSPLALGTARGPWVPGRWPPLPAIAPGGTAPPRPRHLEGQGRPSRVAASSLGARLWREDLGPPAGVGALRNTGGKFGWGPRPSAHCDLVTRSSARPAGGPGGSGLLTGAFRRSQSCPGGQERAVVDLSGVLSPSVPQERWRVCSQSFGP